jgi:hypothetical protein
MVKRNTESRFNSLFQAASDWGSPVAINLFSEHHTGKAVKMRQSPVLAGLPKPDGMRTAGRQ